MDERRILLIACFSHPAQFWLYTLAAALLVPHPCCADSKPNEYSAQATSVVASDDTQLSVAVIDGEPMITSLRSRSDGYDWIDGGKSTVSIHLIDSAEVAGKPVHLKWHFSKQSPAILPVAAKPVESDTGTSAEFRFTCDDDTAGLHLELDCMWRAYGGPGPVEQSVTVLNRGLTPIFLPVQDSLAITMQLPAGHSLEEWWVEKGSSTPTGVGTHREELKSGVASLVECYPSSHDQPRDAIPWISLQDVDGRRGLYAGLEWTARTDFRVEIGGQNESQPTTNPAGVPVHVRAGLTREPQYPFFTRVLPGERFAFPPAFIGCYAGEVDDGANRLRRWVRRHVTPPTRDERYPLLVNNSWGSGMAVDETLARQMIDQSAELGLELFHIDAGWYRRVGDWRPEPAKFAHGLGLIADYAHQKGLKFGLWVGWTQGGDRPDPSGKSGILSVNDPMMRSWFCQAHDRSWRPSDFTGATVCLGEPKAADWCLGQLRGIVEDAKLDLLEHDQIMVTDQCGQEGHAHTASPVDIGYRAAQGYYRVYDTLRAEHPDLLFENCVNGGHMVDYGAVRRCHYISITDTYDPLSNRRAFYDAAYALPPAMCECYVQNEPSLTSRGLPQFRYMLRSGMMGWCTIMTDTRKWTPQQHDGAVREFAMYKSILRPLIQDADLFHVSERPDGIRWDGIEYFNPQSAHGVLFAFRGTTEERSHTFPLKGLDPKKVYALRFQDGSQQDMAFSGADLMRGGLTVELPEAESSEIVQIRESKPIINKY